MARKNMNRGNLALKPYRKEHTLTVIKSIKSSGNAALDVISTELFGFLNTNIASDVQATLAGFNKPKFLEGRKDRRFACSCVIAGVFALFYCSFFIPFNI